MPPRKQDLPVASLEAINAAEDIGHDWVPVPEWGGKVHVRGLSRAEFRRIASDGMDAVQAEAFALEKGMIEPAVTAEQAADLVERKSFSAIETVLARIFELSGTGATFRS